MKTRPKGKRNLRAAALMMLIILTLCAPAALVKAADGDIKANHGAVKIYNYDYDKLVTRLAKKYPAVFKSATVYNAATHAEVGTVTAMRVLITNSKNHTQGGNFRSPAPEMMEYHRKTVGSAWGETIRFNKKDSPQRKDEASTRKEAVFQYVLFGKNLSRHKLHHHSATDLDYLAGNV